MGGAADGHHVRRPARAPAAAAALAVVVALHLTSRRRLGKGRRRAALGVRIAAARGARRRPGRAPARAAGRPPRRRVRRRPVGLRRDAGPRGRARLRPRGARRRSRTRTSAGIVAFGSDALVERLPSELAEIDRIASTPVTRATDIGAALRLAGGPVPRRRPEADRAPLGRQRHHRLRPVGGGAGGGARDPGRDAPGRPRRPRRGARRAAGGPVDGPARRVDRGHGATSPRRSPSRRPSACSSTASWPTTEPVTLDAGTNRVAFTFTPKDPGFLRFRVVVEAARDTFNQNDRADANTIVKGEPKVLVVKGDEDVAAQLVAALETERQVVDTVIPEALPSDLAGARGLRLDRARGRPAAAALRRGDGRAPGLRPRPRPGAGDGRRAARLRRRRLHRHAARGDAAGRHGRPRPRRSSRTSRSSSSSTSRARWTPATATRFDGGMGGGAGSRASRRSTSARRRSCAPRPRSPRRTSSASSRSTTTAHWVVQTAPLGGVTGPPVEAQLASRRTAQTNIFAGLDQAVQSLEDAKATRRHIILLTDGWSSSGQYDADPRADEGRRDHALDGRRGRRREPVPLRKLARGRRRPLLRRREPVLDPRHLPQGDPAGLRPADRRGAVLPDPDLSSSPILRGHRRRLPEPARLQRHDRQARRPDGARHRARRPAPRAVAVRPGAVGRLDVGLDRPLGEELGRRGTSFSTFFSQMVGWTFPGEESGGIEASFEDRGGRTYLRVESVEDDGSARDFYRTQRRAHRAGPRAGDRRPQPGRPRRVRGADRARSTAAPTPSA